MAPGSRALSQNWSTGSSLSPPAAAAAGTVRFSKSLSYALNLNAPSISSTDNAEVQRKGGARSFRGKGSASTSVLTTGSNPMAKKNPSGKATRRPGTGSWTKPLPGPTTSSAATITDRNKLGVMSSPAFAEAASRRQVVRSELYTQRCRAPLAMTTLGTFHQTIKDKFSLSSKYLLI